MSNRKAARSAKPVDRKPTTPGAGSGIQASQSDDARKFVTDTLAGIVQIAHADAESVAAYIKDVAAATHRDVQGSRAVLPDWRRWERLVLARMYHCSLKPDADAAQSLSILALRVALDPRKEIKGDVRQYRWYRDNGGWEIRFYRSAYAAGVSPSLPAWRLSIRCPFRISLLDCLLPPHRDLSRLRRIVVAYLGANPREPFEVPDPGAATQAQIPLTSNERAVYDLIRQQPPGAGLSGKEIRDQLRNTDQEIGQSVLTSHIIPKLKRYYGVQNRRSVGYFIP